VPKEVPPEFYELVDRFIALAKDMTGAHNTSRVSAVIMFAAARYNAHCMLALDPDARQNREAAVAYYVEQYRSMLEHNLDWLALSQDETV
jgi:hypothetical protein